MKTKNTSSNPWERMFISLVVVAVVATIVAGLWIAGSPAQERARKLDASRLNDLQAITNAVDQYYNNNAKNIPSSIDAMLSVRDMYYLSSVKDPETGLPYEYMPKSKDSYDLCASFTTEVHYDDLQPVEPYQMRGNKFWEHGIGRTCFSITARDFQAPLPPVEKPIIVN